MKPTMKILSNLGFLTAALLTLPGVIPAGAQPVAAYVVYPEFDMALADPHDEPPTGDSLALYSGIWDEASVATDGTHQLEGCSFGQMFARDVPYPHFVEATVAQAAALLYPPDDATTVEAVQGSGAAFRYKKLLYQMTGDGKVRAQFESITGMFGAGERAEARAALAILRNGLKYAPLDHGLRFALLDLYYDWIVAEAQLVKHEQAEIAKYRLELVVIPPGELIIDKEIDGYRRMLGQYETILDEYANLFAEPGGVDVSQMDPNARPDITLGLYIFQQEQPYRNQLAPTYCDTNSDLVNLPLLDQEEVFQGYKDYVALLGVLRDYAQSAAELVRLYGMRSRPAQGDQPNDRTLAYQVITNVSDEVMSSCVFLNDLLPDARPTDPASDTAGVLAALAGVQNATAELDKAGGFLNGAKNLLGFDPDFLVLIETFVHATQGHLWDSYDALCGWLDPTRTASPLRHAQDAFAQALASYDTYRGYQDELYNQLSDNDNTYAQRYREITGYLPEDPADPWPASIPANRYPPVPDTNVPPTHVTNPRSGSELRQAYLGIEQANEKQGQLREFGDDLNRQTEAVADSMAYATNTTNMISAAHKKYTEVIRTERDTITGWSAGQAAAQATYDMVSDAAGILANMKPDFATASVTAGAAAVVAVAGAANIAVQTLGEKKKGEAQKELDLAAADYEKDLELAETWEIIRAAAEETRSVERETASLGLTMTDNGFLRNQDLERVDGLVRELEQASAFRMLNNSGLAERYYADPIHFLRAQNNLIRADLKFRTAQRWVFFTLRALEYKYNKPFIYVDPGTSQSWQLSSLFKLRNYRELNDLLGAMEQYNLANLGTINGRTGVTDRVSIKNDVWADALPAANPAARLARFRQDFRNSFNPESGQYEIRLNLHALAAELLTGNLFRGPRYGPNGDLTSPGHYIDKIEWIKVKLLDGTASPEFDVPDCALRYGGTCYLRSFCASPVDQGVSWTGALRAFPFRYYVTYTDTNGVMRAHSSSEQWATIRVRCSNLPGEPTTMEPETFWRERAVAATEWKLTIPQTGLINPDTLEDVEIYVRHRFGKAIACQP